MYCPGEGQSRKIPIAGECSHTPANRSGCGYGNGRNNNASTTLKIAVFAPIPIPSEIRITTVVNQFFLSTRPANTTSYHQLFIAQLLYRRDPDARDHPTHIDSFFGLI